MINKIKQKQIDLYVPKRSAINNNDLLLTKYKHSNTTLKSHGSQKTISVLIKSKHEKPSKQTYYRKDKNDRRGYLQNKIDGEIKNSIDMILKTENSRAIQKSIMLPKLKFQDTMNNFSESDMKNSQEIHDMPVERQRRLEDKRSKTTMNNYVNLRPDNNQTANSNNNTSFGNINVKNPPAYNKNNTEISDRNNKILSRTKKTNITTNNPNDLQQKLKNNKKPDNFIDSGKISPSKDDSESEELLYRADQNNIKNTNISSLNIFDTHVEDQSLIVDEEKIITDIQLQNNIKKNHPPLLSNIKRVNSFNSNQKDGKNKMRKRNMSSMTDTRIRNNYVVIDVEKNRKQKKQQEEKQKKNKQQQQLRQKQRLQKQKLEKQKFSPKDYIKQANIEILADQQKQKRIQSQFYALDLFKQQKNPQITFPQIPTFNLFQPPTLPPPPSLNLIYDTYINSILNVCNILQIRVDYFDIKIQKYHNCILFYAQKRQEAIIWHYNGRFYYGGWKPENSEKKNQENVTTGKKEGDGIQYRGKYWYKGQYKDNKMHGKGIIIYNNGDIYNGKMFQGKRGGYGIFKNKKQNIYYIGNWQNDHQNGLGNLIYSKKHFYSGNFVNSKKKGKGLEHYENGDTYVGNFQENKFSGKGKYYWNSGGIFQGNFSQGCRNGIGLWKSAQLKGDKIQATKKPKTKALYYYGEYIQEQKCGYGIEYLNSNQFYKGYFYKNCRNGMGIFRQNSKIIKAQWKMGKMFTVQYSIHQKN